VVAQEEIAATDEEVDREIERIAERAEQKPARVRRELERNGALEAVRSDVARGKALEFLVEHAKVTDENGNEVDLSVPSPETDSPEPSANEDAQEEPEA
jgi:trigger factor